MKVGDLVRLIKMGIEMDDFGIITKVWNDLDVEVLFHDGEFPMFTKDLALVSKCRFPEKKSASR